MDRGELGGASEDIDGDRGSIESVDPSDDACIPVELGERAELAVVSWEECRRDEPVGEGLDEEACEGREQDDVVVLG